METRDAAEELPGLKLIQAPGNAVRLGRLRRCKTTHIEVAGQGNIIEIADDVSLVNVNIQVLSNGNSLTVGEGTTAGRVNIINGEGRRVRIGADCMLSFDIDLRTTDSHAMEDVATGARINPGADIDIGDHVWIAARASILKGVSIASGCVVALGAIVTRGCAESGAVLAGNPARIVRRGVRWSRPIIG